MKLLLETSDSHIILSQRRDACRAASVTSLGKGSQRFHFVQVAQIACLENIRFGGYWIATQKERAKKKIKARRAKVQWLLWSKSMLLAHPGFGSFRIKHDASQFGAFLPPIPPPAYITSNEFLVPMSSTDAPRKVASQASRN